MTPSDGLTWIYDLPHTLTFSGDALGNAYPTSLAGALPVTVYLPGIGAEEDHPEFFAPSVPDMQPILSQFNDQAEPVAGYSYWASVNDFDSNAPIGSAVVHVPAVVFATPYGATHAKAKPDQIPELMEAWFSLLKAWIEVLVNQPLTELPDVNRSSRGLHVYERSPGCAPKRVQLKQTIRITQLTQQPISKNVWTTALAQVAAGTTPPIEHVFIAGARAALALDDFRKCVLDAATGTEIAFTQLLDNNLSQLPPAMKEAIRKERRTLGTLVTLLSGALALPVGLTKSDLDEGLVKVRNGSIHRGDQPTREQAKQALALATTAVSAVIPLP